jgi:hypothetical protein
VEASAVRRYIRSATGPRQSGPAFSPASPFLIPMRQPTFPELQSVSHPEVFVIMSARWKSSSPYSKPRRMSAWFGTMWQLPMNLS